MSLFTDAACFTILDMQISAQLFAFGMFATNMPTCTTRVNIDTVHRQATSLNSQHVFIVFCSIMTTIMHLFEFWNAIIVLSSVRLCITTLTSLPHVAMARNLKITIKSVNFLFLCFWLTINLILFGVKLSSTSIC